MADRDDDDDDDLIERHHQSPPAKRIKWSKWHVLSSFFFYVVFFSLFDELMTHWAKEKIRKEIEFIDGMWLPLFIFIESLLVRANACSTSNGYRFFFELYPVTSLTRRFRQVFVFSSSSAPLSTLKSKKKHENFLLIRFARNKCEAVGDFRLIFISHQKTSVMKTKSRRIREKKEKFSSLVELLTNEKISRLLLPIR